jgi:glycosyltransferase involved in cell wall biosynthesis
MPAISALMPACNVEPYVADAIQSVVVQSQQDFELLIIDDGSTDGTKRVMERCAAGDERIRFWTRENRGIARTRNELLAEARGEFVAWIDADDVAMPQWLEALQARLAANPADVVAGCRVLLTDPDMLPICVAEHPTRHEEMDAMHLRGERSMMFGSTMMRRTVVQAAGGFRERLVGAEDTDLLLRMAEAGRLACVDQVLYKYRQHAGSIVHRCRSRIAQDAQRVVEDAHRRRGIVNSNVEMKPVASDSAPCIYRRWGWAALMAGNVGTARKYAARTFLKRPLSLESWRLMACAIRGH